MGRFRQTTMDHWNASSLYMRHGREGERVEDYMPENLARTKLRHDQEKPVKKPSKKKER